MTISEIWNVLWPLTVAFCIGVAPGVYLAWIFWCGLRDALEELQRMREDMVQSSLTATKAAIRIRSEGQEESDRLRARLSEASRWLHTFLVGAKEQRGERAALVNLARALRVSVNEESSLRLRRVK